MTSKPVTSRGYYEHNCNRRHASVEAQLKCFFKEGFSTKKQSFGAPQGASCVFIGSGSWAVVHSVDKKRNNFTEYTIWLYETFHEAIELWNEMAETCGGVEKCQPSCSGMYPKIMGVVLGFPYEPAVPVGSGKKKKKQWPARSNHTNLLLPRAKQLF